VLYILRCRGGDDTRDERAPRIALLRGRLITLLECVVARLDEQLRGPGLFPVANVATRLY
jgi:hypothetical protein